MIIVNDLNGDALRIRALPEGSLAPVGLPIVTIENTDARFGWLPGFFEPFLLQHVWYPFPPVQ